VLLTVAACTRSPLTDPKIVLRGATRGDVPRDANGEPMLNRIKPVPPSALPPPPAAPAQPATLPPS
ncbi:MAG: hypothetical protein JO290_00780, partial [Sphingomonadaceae bacterium]|nr:hypothetical protein [Sphingomonadaceae bacterium]